VDSDAGPAVPLPACASADPPSASAANAATATTLCFIRVFMSHPLFVVAFSPGSLDTSDELAMKGSNRRRPRAGQAFD
jgi:hypothetical protein